MAYFWKNLISGFTLPLLTLVLLIIVQLIPDAIPSDIFKTLTPVLLTVATMLALQFKRSRLSIASVLCIIMLSSLLFEPSWVLLGKQQVGLWMSISVTYLMWTRDRGIFTIHGLIQALSILVFSGVLMALLPWLEQVVEPDLHLTFGLPPKLPLPAWQMIVLTATTIVALTRMCMQPSHSNGILFVLMAFGTYSASLTNDTLIFVFFAVFSIGIIAAVLFDSFQMAYRDELTGLPSRRALNQYALTLGKDYTAVMLDVDHFKKFNDTYGHDVGDQVLKLVAARMGQVGGGGRTYRYGGEEFTAIFPRKSAEEVMPHIEALREVIANYKMRLRDENRKEGSKKERKKKAPAKQPTVNVTISLGVATREKGETFEQTIKRADEALYRAKENGRNCSSL